MRKEIYETPRFELLKITLLEDVLAGSIEGGGGSGGGSIDDDIIDEPASPNVYGMSSLDF
jgi:hypothetical protein